MADTSKGAIPKTKKTKKQKKKQKKTDKSQLNVEPYEFKMEDFIDKFQKRMRFLEYNLPEHKNKFSYPEYVEYLARGRKPEPEIKEDFPPLPFPPQLEFYEYKERAAARKRQEEIRKMQEEYGLDLVGVMIESSSGSETEDPLLPALR